VRARRWRQLGRDARLLVAAASLLLALAFPVRADAPGDLLDEINAYRQELALPRVVDSPALSAVARAHVADMAAKGYVGYEAPDGPDLSARLRAAGYEPERVGRLMMVGAHAASFVARRLFSSGELREAIRSDARFEIGIAHTDTPFTVRDGRLATEIWSVLIAQKPPEPLADPIDDLLNEINRARARKRVPPVRLNADLSLAAAAHAEDMIRRGYFEHRSPDGEGPGERVERTPYDYLAYAENLAAGQDSPAAAVDGWDKSPGHARNMYDPTFEDVGLAYRYGPIRQGSTVMYHVWVSVYGKPLGPALGTADAVVDLWEAVNDLRRASGAGSLRLDTSLTQAAEAMADDMIRRGYLSPDAPRGGPSLRERVDATAYQFQTVNALILAGQPAADAVVSEIGSGNRGRELRRARYDDTGIAYRYGPVWVDGKDYHHLWVVLLGQPR